MLDENQALLDDYALRQEGGKIDVSEEVIKRCKARARLMLKDLKKVNPKQYAMVVDPAPHIASICPRRAGKSYGGAIAAMILGESQPGAISLIISLNKQQLRRIYWSGGPSGLYMLARKYNLKLTFNNTYLRWEHENGSIGYLLGCEDDEQMEVIRGLEADLYLIDECKSFSPYKLEKLIDEIIDPQRSSRQGRLMLIGTPGFIAAGPFYQATCLHARDGESMTYALPFGAQDPWGRTCADDLLWSLHSWTLQENTAKPQQWIDGLKKKKNKKWADDHPVWLREYLGQWTTSGDGLVFRYALEKAAGRCTWVPQRTKENPTGLPAEGAPWFLIGGLDLGYEAPTAFVLAAYSMRLRQLRHVWDFSGRHMLTHEIAGMITAAHKRFGKILHIYADASGLGETMVAELVRDFGLPVEKAKKREKLDYIEQLNSAFSLNEVQIISTDPETGKPTALETQLLTNAWDLDDGMEDVKLGLSIKENMGRLGKLKEDDAIPNDSTDALVYLFRGSMHRFGRTQKQAEVTPGTEEWFAQWEAAQLAKARREYAIASDARLGSSKFEVPRGMRSAFSPQVILPKAARWSSSTRDT